MYKKQVSLLLLANFLVISPALAATDKEVLQSVTALQESSKQHNIDLQKLNKKNDVLRTELIERDQKYLKDMATLNTKISDLSTQQVATDGELSKVNDSVISLNKNTENKISQLSQQLNSLSDSTENKTSQLSQQLSSRTIAIIVGLLTLLGLLAASFFALKKRQTESSEGLLVKVQSALTNVKLSEENIVKSDTQLADKLLEVLEQMKQTPILPAVAPVSGSAIPTTSHEPDHGLAIKLADEIHRMRKRIEALPDDTKGIKSLSKSLERLEEELKEQGYEIIDYIGTNYSENMSIQARFIPSDDLDEGQSIITKVVLPQVNYQGKLTRMADVEVSVG